MSINEEFDWCRDRDSIVVAEQLQIAVYENGEGNLVIRQQDWSNQDDDYIVVAKANVPAVCRALCLAAGLETAQPSVTLLPPAKSSGAERSRRYRERHAQRDGRDNDRDSSGSGRDADSLIGATNTDDGAGPTGI